MTYRTAVIVMHILVIVPSIAFVVAFATSATARSWRNLAAYPLVALPALSGFLSVRSLVLMWLQEPAAAQARDAARTVQERVFGVGSLAAVALTLYVLLVALWRARKVVEEQPDAD